MTSDFPPGRASHVLIDLDAHAVNIRAILDILSPGTRLMAVVKADAYGHGAAMIARSALAAGASHLAVATVTEGGHLRLSGITAPILVLGPVHPPEIPTALHHRLTLTVADESTIGHIPSSARQVGRTDPIDVHLKIDTGMRRFGAIPEQIPHLAQRIIDVGLVLTGVYTHLAGADEEDESFALEQAQRFDRCVAHLPFHASTTPILHVANSAATLRSRRYDYDLVRVGIAQYGLPPSPHVPLLPTMLPVMRVRSRVARVISLAPGDSVGYGRTYRATAAERAGLVPIGYADGYSRALSSRGWMGIHNSKAPVRGRVSMDQTVVGIPDGTPVEIGDPIDIVGGQGPTLTQLAELSNTINYEFATLLALRLPRHYVNKGRLVQAEEPWHARAGERPTFPPHDVGGTVSGSPESSTQ